MTLTDVPKSISSLVFGLGCIAVYCLVFSVPLTAVGLFSGPSILAGAATHVAVGVVFLALRNRVLHASRFAARILVLLLCSGIVGLAYVLWLMFEASEPFGAMLVPGILLAAFGAMLLLLASGSSRCFFAGKSGNRKI